MIAIRIEGLVKTYGAVRALDGLDLTVESGAVFGFLGPNGAGKSTTMRILTGLARPTAGKAEIAGMPIASRGGEIARRIGYLPEDPAFYAWMTPREFLDHVGRVFGMPAGARRARGGELLVLLGLESAAKRRIGGFSRGMRQRLGLAQALMNKPEILFLDEPVSALDPAGRKEVLELIGGLAGQCTVFMSSHILEDVERICGTIAIIASGRLVAEAPRDELLARYATPAFEMECEEGSTAELQRWADGLRDEPWVRSVTIDGAAARILARDRERAMRELLPAAVRAGLILTRFAVARPSLEDVFLQLVNGGNHTP
jgi:ABC-2 type transport system ATP-binding protein